MKDADGSWRWRDSTDEQRRMNIPVSTAAAAGDENSDGQISNEITYRIE